MLFEISIHCLGCYDIISLISLISRYKIQNLVIWISNTYTLSSNLYDDCLISLPRLFFIRLKDLDKLQIYTQKIYHKLNHTFTKKTTNLKLYFGFIKTFKNSYEQDITKNWMVTKNTK